MVFTIYKTVDNSTLYSCITYYKKTVFLTVYIHIRLIRVNSIFCSYDFFLFIENRFNREPLKNNVKEEILK